MKRNHPKKNVFDVLDEFIVAVEETKEVLQSPKAPGRPEFCCLCRKRERHRKKLESIPEFVPRLSASEGDISRCSCTNQLSFDETDFLIEHETQEEKAKGLVFEMETLLNKLSTAASSLKVIYRRRSTEDIQISITND